MTNLEKIEQKCVYNGYRITFGGSDVVIFGVISYR